jgi:hypothetical protein
MASEWDAVDRPDMPLEVCPHGRQPGGLIYKARDKLPFPAMDT